MELHHSESRYEAARADARRLDAVLPQIGQIAEPRTSPTASGSMSPPQDSGFRSEEGQPSGRLRTEEVCSDQVWQDVCKVLLPVVRRLTNMIMRQFSYRERVCGVGDDIVQDVFCRLLERDRAVLRRIADMDSDSALAYLYTLIRRRVIDRVRRMNAARRQGEQTASPMQSAAGTPAGPESDPERRFMVREARRQLRRALARVSSGRHSDRERVIFELAADGWPSPEIGLAVNPKMSPGAVDVAVCRTRKKLEERFFDEIGILERRGR